jgi:hypothetical protein
MSALGHKRTNRPAPKSIFVRFGPLADKLGYDVIARANSGHPTYWTPTPGTPT